MEQETLEEVAGRLYPIILEEGVWDKNKQYRDVWINGAKWQQEQDKNKFSEEDMLNFAQKYAVNTLDKSHIEQFKKK